ncbi:MAG: acyltransferase domain-containing protein [Bacteroidota bacterium]|nr:acyltransferase domain-containing protein [Bacteroidota bacterium]
MNADGSADGAFGTAPGRFISAPTHHSQVALMRLAAARAGRTADQFDYIEAHATGTQVGDRIEGNGISETFRGHRKHPLRVSSVQSNVGHMEAAAFSCALLKVVLMMRHRTFAPISKTFQVPNPEIDFDLCPMRVQTECEPFPDHPVIIGINSFGFGGANGHCVVREYRPERTRIWSASTAPKAGFMVPLSARSSSALVQSTRRLRTFVDEHDLDLYTLAGNLSRRRTPFAARAAFAVRSKAELTRALEEFELAERSPPPAEDGHKSVAMVFSGQGTQWAGCGRALYETHPVFRRVIDRIEAYWVRDAEYSLRDTWFNAPQDKIDQCALAQPVIFAVQCALYELFRTWGVYADCVVGHSSGEIAAAYACGVLSLEEATRLVYYRSMLQQRVAGSGRMLSLGLDVPGVKDLLERVGSPMQTGSRPDAVQIACENSPANIVVCGRPEVLQPILEEARRRNLQHTLIPGNIAFHSAAMEVIRNDVLTALEFLNGRTYRSEIPLISTVTGLVEQNLDAAYWWSNVRQPVRFLEAISTVMRNCRPDIFLEIAPIPPCSR